MRTTSGAVLSENSLKFKELDEKRSCADGRIRVECVGLTGWWFSPVSCFGRVDRKRLKEVVDSGFERCRMRLPLTRRSSDLKRKRLRRNEKFFKNSLTD
jgi:hypothetical protein